MLKKIITIFLIVTFSIGCLTCFAIKTKATYLTQKFGEKEVLKYRLEQTITNTIDVKGTIQSQVYNKKFELTTAIDTIIKDSIFISVSIDSAEASVKTNFGIQDVPDIGEYISLKAKIVLLPEGEFEILECPEKLKEETAQFSLESFIKSIYGFMPNKEVSINSTWEKDFVEKGYTARKIFTFSGFKKNKEGLQVMVLDSQSEISIDQKLKQANTEVRNQLTGKGEGTTECIKGSGIVLFDKTHLALEGTSSINSPIQGEMELPVYVNMDSKLERIQ